MTKQVKKATQLMALLAKLYHHGLLSASEATPTPSTLLVPWR